MRLKRSLIAGVFFLLAGCGTMKMGIDFGNTPAVTTSESSPEYAKTSDAMSTAAPTSTRTSTPSRFPTESSVHSPTVTPDNRITAVAAGSGFTCALAASGRVKCWGDNEYGQLGNGTRIDSNVPADVVGLTDAQAITAGRRHACALIVGGGVKCWGYNRNGELGDGVTVDRSRPVDAEGLSSGAAAIDAGDDHTCVATSAGGVKCWGYNEYGQLGDGTKSSRSVPVDTAGFSGGVISIAAGWGHTCALTSKGGAKCWGNNEYGQLGYGQPVVLRLTPMDVTGLTYGVLKISAEGGQSCALTAGGGVSCWGNNKYGQLGDGTGLARNNPVQAVGLLEGVRDVKTGWNHTCAVLSGGELDCWGWNFYGQLGDGTKITRSVPSRVAWPTDGIKDIAVGWTHTCAATGLGAVKCWGSNESGQLGDGTRENRSTPVAAIGL
jgi:alpha-tubulin suppressor-like RCC1 family protein